jgi:hypothetical protein
MTLVNLDSILTTPIFKTKFAQQGLQNLESIFC